MSTHADLVKDASERSFEVVTETLKAMSGLEVNWNEVLRESQAATCALQEIARRVNREAAEKV